MNILEDAFEPKLGKACIFGDLEVVNEAVPYGYRASAKPTAPRQRGGEEKQIAVSGRKKIAEPATASRNGSELGGL